MINLKNNMGFKWIQTENLYIKGYDGEINKKYHLIQKNSNDISFFMKEIKNFKGNFSIVFENDELIFAAADRIRSLPLFYGIKNGDFYLSDDARWIYEQVLDKNIDETSKVEFYLSGYVTGANTLYSNVKQIQAGEYIIFNKKEGTLTKSNYFTFRHGNYFKKSQDELIEVLDQVHIKVFQRLIRSLNGRTAVLPLSGGYDSRLIAIMLNRLGYKDVICFSYGNQDDKEAIISKKVAEKLGYKWLFIAYTKENWIEWYNSDRRKQYFQYADGLSSIPHIQDVIAVEELKKKELIPTDSIFIPGHAGDFVAGSHIPEQFVTNQQISSKMIVDQILNVHYKLWDDRKLIRGYKGEFSKKIFDIIEYRDFYSNDEAADVYEQWDWSERQAKFIANSIRVYDFHGYEWRLPLWEKEIVEFWGRVPLENRLNRRLYFDYVLRKQSDFSHLNRNQVNNYSKFIKSLIEKIPSLYNYVIYYQRIKFMKNHPLGWNAIIENCNLDKNKLRKMDNINSYLTYDYLK
ncbi:asparagine synthase-related protein [Frankia sp. AgKG'84/4]